MLRTTSHLGKWLVLAAVLVLSSGCDSGPAAGGCGPATCGGCCEGTECIQSATDEACGAGGFPCVDCTATGGFCNASGRCEGGGSCGPCSGCCQGQSCVQNPTDSACGTSGATCVDCTQTSQTCDVGTGTCEGGGACGPGSCSGCCQGQSCVQNPTDTACGTSGTTCVDCTQASQTCDVGTGTCEGGGSCGPCSGCCQGSSCIQSPTDAACGTGGNPCQACASDEQCVGGQCVPQGTALYAVFLKSASLLVSPWVACVEASCDMYVELTVGNVTATSSTVSNNNSPVWNEQLMIASQSDITSSFEAKVLDDDIGPVVGSLGACSANVTPADLKSGAITVTCADLFDTCEVTFGFVQQ